MNPSRPYLAQLDGLRGLAILCVLFEHFYSGRFALGAIGVKLFFVLSGFLITGILLKCKQAAESGADSRGDCLRRFYARRLIRIMPLFYLVLLVLFVLNSPGVRASFGWHAAYLSNVYFALRGEWQGVLGPYWSLAVEEQFYLVWPFVILLTPHRRLPLLMMMVLLAGLLFCLIAPSSGLNGVALYALPFASFVQLGMGAFVAVLFDASFGLSRFQPLLARAGFYLGIPLLALVVMLQYLEIDQQTGLLLNVSIALLSAWLVIGAAHGSLGLRGKLLSNTALRFIGTISYGIYILHLPSREIVLHYVPHLNAGFDALLQSAFTIYLATISWYAFESPINRLKRYFDYAPVRAVKPPEETQIQSLDVAMEYRV